MGRPLFLGTSKEEILTQAGGILSFFLPQSLEPFMVKGVGGHRHITCTNI